MPGKPNLLVFLTDDHGQWASSAYGNRELHTPVMQWMADTGVRFDHAFCPNPVCSPARASFWNGQIPSRHGIHDWLGETRETTDHHGIAGQDTLGTFLKAQGYSTGLVGKWHAGDSRHPMPGFDTWFTSLLGTRAAFKSQQFIDGTDRIEAHGHQEVFYTERAIRFLREQAESEDPFFLFVGYTNTHTPHNAEPAPLRHHYRNCAFSDIPREPHLALHGRPRFGIFNPDDPARRKELADYYASIENIDQQMLRIITELENMGQLDNTVIIYTSDHGHMNGHHGLHTKANATNPANFLEESIHVPLLMRGPGLPSGLKVSRRSDHCDLHATLLDLAGADRDAILARQGSPGESLLPLIRDPDALRRDIQFCESGPNRMARTDTAKLIRRYPHPSGVEVCDAFYDLVSDPRETVNAIQEPAHAKVIADLSAAMDAYYAEYEDPEKSGITASGLSVKHNPSDLWREKPG